MSHADAESMEPLSARLVLATDPVKVLLLMTLYESPVAFITHFFVILVAHILRELTVNLLGDGSNELARQKLFLGRLVGNLQRIQGLRLINVSYIIGGIVLVTWLP
tara:strand:+ start:234 stop:551 length:318 start_codon:yes stop_codon:yes gene_type:complete